MLKNPWVHENGEPGAPVVVLGTVTQSSSSSRQLMEAADIVITTTIKRRSKQIKLSLAIDFFIFYFTFSGKNIYVFFFFLPFLKASMHAWLFWYNIATYFFFFATYLACD